MDGQLHWLEAQADLSLWREQIWMEVAETCAIISRLITPPRLDILVQRGSMVIPEIGMVGQAYSKGLFALTFDPGNPNFATCLGGEASVSEGLAGHFTRWLFNNPPEPWNPL